MSLRFVHFFVRSFICFCIRVFLRSFVPLLVPWVAPLFVASFVPLFISLLIPLFVHLFLYHSFVRSITLFAPSLFLVHSVVKLNKISNYIFVSGSSFSHCQRILNCKWIRIKRAHNINCVKKDHVM